MPNKNRDVGAALRPRTSVPLDGSEATAQAVTNINTGRGQRAASYKILGMYQSANNPVMLIVMVYGSAITTILP